MNASSLEEITTLTCSAAEIIDGVLQQDRRLLLFGPPGVGKTTLTSELGRELHARGRRCWSISADPGSPGFGVPGAVMLGRWEDDSWQVETYAALCTLDAGRFRLPLVSAVQRLAEPAFDGVLLIDAPGVVRGTAGRELLQGLIAATDADALLALNADDCEPPLLDELRSLALDLFLIRAATEARRPSKRARARRRTELWDAYLAEATTQAIELRKVNLIGTPPPPGEEAAWAGRQVALLQHGQTHTLGEVLRLDGGRLTVRLPAEAASADSVLIRDALRSTEGLMETAAPFLAERIEYLPPADVVPSPEESGGPRVVGRVGHVDVGLLNGVFGDPLLHLRIRHQGRSLLFDLGGGARLPARLAHQVTDLFISHAHMDHLSGFQWLLRSRLEKLPPCRVYGPPGLAGHIEGFIQSFLWDRIKEKAPTFLVSEIHGERLRRYRITVADGGCELLGEEPLEDGIVLREPEFCIRAALLDHHTPVIAYAFEAERELNVRKDRLLALGYEPGPWLARLKQAVLKGEHDAIITLSDGSEMAVGELADALILVTPGKRLVYATDLADTEENRQRLIALAHHAHTLFCEAPFIEADTEQAARTGHLTTRACGEIAAAAGVARLIPFHFSRRYEDNPQQLYDEIDRACSCLIAPRATHLFAPAVSGEQEAVEALEIDDEQ